MSVLSVVENIVSEYGTRDPYVIADKCGILVCEENLGSLNGYYCTAFGIRSIHINRNLSDMMKKITCAHEIGHAHLHHQLNVNVMLENTLMLKGKYEKQANLFASCLIFPDEVLKEYEGYSCEEIASALEVPPYIISLRNKI